MHDLSRSLLADHRNPTLSEQRTSGTSFGQGTRTRDARPAVGRERRAVRRLRSRPTNIRYAANTSRSLASSVSERFV